MGWALNGALAQCSAMQTKNNNINILMLRNYYSLLTAIVSVLKQRDASFTSTKVVFNTVDAALHLRIICQKD